MESRRTVVEGCQRPARVRLSSRFLVSLERSTSEQRASTQDEDGRSFRMRIRHDKSDLRGPCAEVQRRQRYEQNPASGVQGIGTSCNAATATSAGSVAAAQAGQHQTVADDGRPWGASGGGCASGVNRGCREQNRRPKPPGPRPLRCEISW